MVFLLQNLGLRFKHHLITLTSPNTENEYLLSTQVHSDSRDYTMSDIIL